MTNAATMGHMADAYPSRQRSERRASANPGLAALVCLGWYVAVASVSLWVVSRQSGAAPQGCDDDLCLSDRGEWTAFALAIGLPALFLSLVISLLLLGLLAAKDRIRSTTFLGSVAASPALLPVFWLIATNLR